jgi:trehalose 6-phosphate phosphatase
MRAAVKKPGALDRRAALFLDVDGTLLEIAPRPDLVSVPPGLPALIERCARARGGALALVSGRPVVDLDRLFRPWRGAAAGLHGIERRGADGVLRRIPLGDGAAALDRIRPRLFALAQQIPGLLVEDKGATVALHYRAVPQSEPAVIAAATALLPPALRLIPGKMVVEFQPRAGNKGAAVAAFLGEPPFLDRPPVYLGDDTTDEDGFAEVNRRGGLSILVGPRRDTAATHHLASVAAALAWLAGAAGLPAKQAPGGNDPSLDNVWQKGKKRG